ncbi:hypothetical protein C8Q76DRAFT_688005 [Earliella scabrosa]|nr:hypothetical protein C8Q76DRAFT_688005 [Earliella scabrosa]
MGLTDAQCELLLEFFLVYHGFVTHHPALPPNAFSSFCVSLVERAVQLGPFECADAALADVVYWAHKSIPQTVLIAPIFSDTDDLGDGAHLPISACAVEHFLCAHAFPIRQSVMSSHMDGADLPPLIHDRDSLLPCIQQ